LRERAIAAAARRDLAPKRLSAERVAANGVAARVGATRRRLVDLGRDDARQVILSGVQRGVVGLFGARSVWSAERPEDTRRARHQGIHRLRDPADVGVILWLLVLALLVD